MAERRTTVDGLADAIMDGLKEYADLATDTIKDAVKDVSKTVKKDIQANAPKRTGRYKKSWTVKKTAESSNSLTMTVHSKDRYQIAHLLEHGHAKRGGGREGSILLRQRQKETGSFCRRLKGGCVHDT